MNFTGKKKSIWIKTFGIAFAVALVLAAVILPIYFLVLNKPSPPPVIEISDGKGKSVTLDGTGRNSDNMMLWKPFNEANVSSYGAIKQAMADKGLKDFNKITYIWDICLNCSTRFNLSTISTINLKTKKKVVAYVFDSCVLSDKYPTFNLQKYELKQMSEITLPAPGMATIMVYEEEENN